MASTVSAVKLFDTSRREVVPFTPGDEVRMYVCGITPYDSTHLGHANTYLTFDLLIRRLEDLGHTVKLVRNITDVDDSILPKARELGIDFLELAAAETARFNSDMVALNTRPVFNEPHASKWVAEMVELIERLSAGGHIYAVDGTVFFDTSTFDSFGSLSGYDQATMVEIAAKRGGNPDDPRQRNRLDFVLWQPSRADEPSWPSPWGAGRPGWHIECSAMSAAILGSTLDLHGGGSDLIFPHHECTRAQSEAATGVPLARHWMHCGMVQYQGTKMSKSLGNLVFVSELAERADPRSIRLALMAHHYRSDWEWFDGDIDAGAATLDRLHAAVKQAAGPDPVPYARRLRAALDDDLDAPRALAELDALAAAILANPGTEVNTTPTAPGILRELAGLCGIELDSPPDPNRRTPVIRLFDTLSGDVRPLAQRYAGKVSLYACGPTVYDHPHLGHARQAMTYDIIRRYLEWRGVEVLHVANVTDIDDNIINRANREGTTESALAKQWERIYIEAMDALDILHPHERPHATDYVDEMVAFIETLMDNGSAYANDSGVYLRVHTIDGYGGLVHRTLDELREGIGARVDVDDNKEDPLDFALWKAAKPGEPTWPSPWGEGRPGWHIECAAMSIGILGDGFDLHGGGTDLVFPHHTNERAEAIAAGREFASHWMHNAMLNIGGEKMSKSLDNYTTVQALLDEHPLNGRALRLLLLQTHYRKTMELNPEIMEQSRRAIERLDAMARKAHGAGIASNGSGRDQTAVNAFVTALDDDLGTPEAVATIFDLVRRANRALDNNDADDADGVAASTLVTTAIELASALGLRIAEPEACDTAADTVSDAEIDALVEARTAARSRKDFAEADRIRYELTARGIVVEDTPKGPLWRRPLT